MPTLAELRSKATKLADASTTKMKDTRDHWSSQPSKNINWDAEPKTKPPPPPKGPKPPPPPARNSSSSSSASASLLKEKPLVPLRRAGSSASGHSFSLAKSPNASSGMPPPARPLSTVSDSQPAGPPPIIRRDTRPDLVSHLPSTLSGSNSPRLPTISEPQQDIDCIDWVNLSPEDKQAFFSWLDEFFARFLQVPVPPRSATTTVQHVKVPPGVHTPPPMTGPPKLSMASRPKTPPRPALGGSIEFTTSHPPCPQHGSAAEDLAHYFAPSTHWPSAWYASDTDMMAPPIRTNSHKAYTASWSSDGTTKTLRGGVFFSDLSMCFYAVSWPQHAPPTHDPNDARTVRRSAQYLPRPGPWPRARLVDAHETYGETIAGFAESFEDGGVPCARGECWDLANEALKCFEQYDYVPKPVPSISRTHGHLIYEGKAAEKGRTQAGRWRGGDDRVRRGDIVEWRSVRLSMGPGGWAILGNPDHTAVIVCEMVPRVSVADGMAVGPSDMGTLEVVEQSVGSPPKRMRYDLANLEEGEVWIYRPVGMEAYVGALLAPQCPEGLNALSL